MRAFEQSRPQLPLAVAYSGGADSTALLLACHLRWPGQVLAWHIHHGLQVAADAFERHCQAKCLHLGIDFSCRYVDARPAPGESPEDAARKHRYRALDDLAGASRVAVGSVLLAQHADDQLETILLALARGAGLPGLAAMPQYWQTNGTNYARPFLHVPAWALRSWLLAQGQDWIEDPSNQDTRYLRNRIRTELLPVIQRLLPQYAQTFQRSATHAAQAQIILDQVAQQDLTSCGQPPAIHSLQNLSVTRQGNVLRYWLRSTYGQVPSTAQLRELLAQLNACTTRGHQIELKVGSGKVLRQADVLFWKPS